MKAKTGLENLFLEQIFTFDSLERDPRDRVLSVSHFGLVNLSLVSRFFGHRGGRKFLDFAERAIFLNLALAFEKKSLKNVQLFFAKNIEKGIAFLADDEIGHLAVLRKKAGDRVDLIDGSGLFFEAEILELSKKSASARVLAQKKDPKSRDFGLHIAIAPTKNLDRFEWFLEKSTEIGIAQITPILTKRSERTVLKTERLEKIILSAAKQSCRAELPKLAQLIDYQSFMKTQAGAGGFIAHCFEGEKAHLKNLLEPKKSAVVLIGPEGDFTPDEAEKARLAGFVGCSLGAARLRTETAGVFVAALFEAANSAD